MLQRIRTPRATAALFLLAAIPGAIATIQPSAAANADVCASANGQHASVSGCADISGAINYYAPPPAYYAPLPQDFDPLPKVTTCVSGTGRRGNLTGTVDLTVFPA